MKSINNSQAVVQQPLRYQNLIIL